MKRKLDPRAAVTRQGSFSLTVAAGNVSGVLVTQSASVFVRIGEDVILIWSGEGKCEFDFQMPNDGVFWVSTPDADVYSSLWLREWRLPQLEAGWADGEPYAQLEVKHASDVPPEIRQMFETMQRNTLTREMMLRQEIERLRG